MSDFGRFAVLQQIINFSSFGIIDNSDKKSLPRLLPIFPISELSEIQTHIPNLQSIEVKDGLTGLTRGTTAGDRGRGHIPKGMGIFGYSLSGLNI